MFWFGRRRCLMPNGALYAALPAENDREDPPVEPFLLSLTLEHGAARLWLRCPASPMRSF